MSNRPKWWMVEVHIALVTVFIASGCGGNAGTTPSATSCADNPPGCLCSGDDTCGGANPRCDFHTGRCVPCLPESDSCGHGLLCVRDGGGYRCAAGCLATSDCPRVGDVQQQCCGGACIDVTRSTDHCGACGSACAAPANGQASCVGGGCVIGSCSAGFGDCDGKASNGCETSIADSPAHCGACGTACPSGANSTPTCSAGRCATSCVQGYGDCDGRPETGCEVNLVKDASNCGACGTLCGPLEHATSTACSAGRCVPAACSGWYGDCDGKPDNGCESDTQSDVNNCGGCGVACPVPPNGEVACLAGTCLLTRCAAGYGDCDGNAANGCELPVWNDAANCGGCGVRCSGANGTQTCEGGSCKVSLCNLGFADCDGDARNGCESNTLAEANHCGGCGNICQPAPNALVTCTLGVCKPGACKPGFADCNGDPLDGCEVDITTVDNCGSCGVACAAPANGTAMCLAGRCTIAACNPGFASCDNNDKNGCESSLVADPKSCGACGIVCSYAHAAPACAAGKCLMGACDKGRADCNKDDKDGCELAVDADPKNCGGCGVVCGGNEPYCVSGSCTASTHAVAQLAWDYQTFSEGCGNYSIWSSLDVGSMTWDDCEAAANRYGAMMMGQTGWFGSYGAPYQWDERWVGEADVKSGWVSTSGWDSVYADDKSALHKCVLAYANGTEHGADTLPNTLTSINGKSYQVDDLGVIDEADCYSKARQAGARPLNPWMFVGVNQDTAFMSENHICHGSTLYGGLGSYGADGEEFHVYRCFIGYNP